MNCRITQATPPIQHATSYAFPWYRVTHIPIQSSEGCIRFDPQPSSVSTPEGLGRLETLQKRNKLGSNLIVAFQDPPSVFHLISKYFFFGVAYNLHVDMFRIASSCSHDCIMEKKWAEAGDSADQAHETSSNPVPPYHHHKMHITFSFESRKHLGRTYKAPALLGSTARQKSKNTWDTSEVAVATPIRWITGSLVYKCNQIPTSSELHSSKFYHPSSTHHVHHQHLSTANGSHLPPIADVLRTLLQAHQLCRSHRPVRNGWRYVSRRRVKT